MSEEDGLGPSPDGSVTGVEIAPPAPEAAQPASVRPAKPWEQAGGGGGGGGGVTAVAPSPTPTPAPPAQQAPAALREDQIQNAVAFLSHPKVRSSTDAAKRTFLEKKGVTASEIEEAFRRVPSDASPAPVPASAAVVPPPAAQVPNQPPPQQVVTYAQPPPPPQPEPVRWSQVVLGAGLAALVVVGVKRLLEPYRYQILHTLSRAIMPAEDQERLDELTAEGANGSKSGGEESAQIALKLSEAVQTMGTQQAQLAQAISALSAKLDSTPSPAAPSPAAAAGPELQEAFRELQGTIKSLSSSLEGMRQPAQSPQEVQSSQFLQGATAHTFPMRPEVSTGGHTSLSPQDKGKAPMNPAATKSPSYQEVMQMLQEGKVPPGIRSDIKDNPPNPSQPPSDSHQSVRKKPWERSLSPMPPSSLPAGEEVAEAPPPFWMRGAPSEQQGSPASNGSLQERSSSLAAASIEVEYDTWNGGDHQAPPPAEVAPPATGASEESPWKPPAMPKRTLATTTAPPAVRPQVPAEPKSTPAPSYSAALRGEGSPEPRETPQGGPEMNAGAEDPATVAGADENGGSKAVGVDAEAE